MEISVKNVRDNLAEIINQVAYRGERVVLQRRGKRVVALVPLAALQRLEETEDQQDVKAARKARKEKGGVTLAQYRKKHGL